MFGIKKKTKQPLVDRVPDGALYVNKDTGKMIRKGDIQYEKEYQFINDGKTPINIDTLENKVTPLTIVQDRLYEISKSGVTDAQRIENVKKQLSYIQSKK